MNLVDDALIELLRLVIGVAVVAVLVWVCGFMPRTYVTLKMAALALWGALSFGIPAFVLIAVYIPTRQYVLGAIAVSAGAACMVCPFVKFGWPALRDTFRPGATQRP